MQSPDVDLIARRQRESARWWRIAFLAYVIALETATHWPALDIGSEAYPATDKIIHLYAFAMFAALLWRTRWIARRSTLVLVGLAYALVNELTQSIPILARSWSWMDLAGSSLGVLVVGAWLWALRPLGGELNRRRLRLAALVIDDLFASIRPGRHLAAWVILVGILAPIGAGFLTVWPVVMTMLPNPLPAMAYGAGLAAWVGLMLYFAQHVWRRAMDEALAWRRCRACGGSCAGVAFDGAGAGACPACGTRLHVGEWLPRIGPDSDRLKRMAAAPGLVGLVTMVAPGAALIAAVLLFRAAAASGRGGDSVAAVFRWLSHVPDDFVMTVDFALLLVALAVTLRLYRSRLAAFHDRQHVECRACGHDLRATPVSAGLGTCGECGTQFARLAESATEGTENTE